MGNQLNINFQLKFLQTNFFKSCSFCETLNLAFGYHLSLERKRLKKEKYTAKKQAKSKKGLKDYSIDREQTKNFRICFNKKSLLDGLLHTCAALSCNWRKQSLNWLPFLSLCFKFALQDACHDISFIVMSLFIANFETLIVTQYNR